MINTKEKSEHEQYKKQGVQSGEDKKKREVYRKFTVPWSAGKITGIRYRNLAGYSCQSRHQGRFLPARHTMYSRENGWATPGHYRKNAV